MIFDDRVPFRCVLTICVKSWPGEKDDGRGNCPDQREIHWRGLDEGEDGNRKVRQAVKAHSEEYVPRSNVHETEEDSVKEMKFRLAGYSRIRSET